MKRAMAVFALSLSLALLMAAACAVSAQHDADRLREQMRDRQRVIDADLRSLRAQRRGAAFGGSVYRELGRSIRALESERSAH